MAQVLQNMKEKKTTCRTSSPEGDSGLFTEKKHAKIQHSNRGKGLSKISKREHFFKKCVGCMNQKKKLLETDKCLLVVIAICQKLPLQRN